MYIKGRRAESHGVVPAALSVADGYSAPHSKRRAACRRCSHRTQRDKAISAALEKADAADASDSLYVTFPAWWRKEKCLFRSLTPKYSRPVCCNATLGRRRIEP